MKKRTKQGKYKKVTLIDRLPLSKAIIGSICLIILTMTLIGFTGSLKGIERDASTSVGHIIQD